MKSQAQLHVLNFILNKEFQTVKFSNEKGFLLYPRHVDMYTNKY